MPSKTGITAGRGAPTLVHVARAAGVSPAVVCSLLRGTDGPAGTRNRVGFSAATATRVLRACRRLHYDPPDPVARIRIYPEEGEYAFLLASGASDGLANPYFSRIIHGVVQALGTPCGHHLTFAHFDSTIDYLTVRERLPAPARNGVVNRFVLAGEPNYSLLHFLQQRGAAVVYVSRYVSVSGLVSVLTDHAVAASMAIDYLTGLGHRRIAVCAPDYFQPDTYPVRQFAKGASAAMRLAGQPFLAADIVYTSTSDEGARDTLAAVLSTRPGPTAVFCCGDGVAAALIRAAPALRVRIPQDLSIMGCNDDAMATTVHPFLTTIHFPCEEMGRRAVHELQRAFDKAAPVRPRRIVVPSTLIERESTAPYRGPRQYSPSMPATE